MFSKKLAAAAGLTTLALVFPAAAQEVKIEKLIPEKTLTENRGVIRFQTKDGVDCVLINEHWLNGAGTPHGNGSITCDWTGKDKKPSATPQ